MPRVRRRHTPGAPVHVITRFVNGEPFLDRLPEARAQYLQRLALALSRTDWVLCFYALMSTHTHLAMICGSEPLSSWARVLHTGFSGWLNRAERVRGLRSRGPIIAERPKSLLVPLQIMRNLAAYIHNNPVRAGIVASAEHSTWTSHRAYLGLSAPEGGLSLDAGFAFFDQQPSAAGRLAIHDFVCQRSADTSDPSVAEHSIHRARARARSRWGRAVELSTPTWHSGVSHFPIACTPHVRLLPGYGGNAAGFIARLPGVIPCSATDLTSLGTGRAASAARKQAVLIWRALGRPMKELCSVLALGQSAASNILARATVRERKLAEQSANRFLREHCEL